MSQIVAGSCLQYRVTVLEQSLVRDIARKLASVEGGPTRVVLTTSPVSYVRYFEHELRSLLEEFQDVTKYFHLDFSLKFQLHRLAQNGYMSPRAVSLLFPDIAKKAKYHSVVTLRKALRSAALALPYIGSDESATPEQFSHAAFLSHVHIYARDHVMDESIELVAMRNTHLGLVHRVIVTPAGTYLEGPDVENMHRVQRKYPNYPTTSCESDSATKISIPFAMNLPLTEVKSSKNVSNMFSPRACISLDYTSRF